VFNGIRVKINEEEYVIPPISLGQLRHGVLELLQTHDQLVADGKTFEAMSVRAQVILEAIRRNYPDFAEEVLLNYLDMANTSNIWLSILGVSGFAPGEESAVTVAPPNRGNGTLDLSTAA
jgi:hypothetical protein